MKKHYIYYLLSLLLFGSNGILASKINASSYEIVFYRTLIGSLLLFLIFIGGKNKFTFFHYPKQLLSLIFSGVALGIGWIFLYEAYQLIGVSIASLAYYCGPVIVMALSPLLFNEKLTKIKVSGFLIVLLGIGLINNHALKEGIDHIGLVFGILSAVMYALMVIFNRSVTAIKGLENSTLQLMCSCITVAIFILIKQGTILPLPTQGILPMMFLGLINTGLGCYFYFASLGTLPVQTVAVCGYLEPLSAVIFSVLFLNEHMQSIQVLGAVCIIGGAIMSENLSLKHTLRKKVDKLNYL